MSIHPKTFKDGAGREWTVNFTLASASCMRDLTGKQIDDFIPKATATAEQISPFREFVSDPFAVFEVFYALVKPDADKLGLTKEQILEGFTGEKDVEAMACAVIQAFVDFFRQPDPARAMILSRHLDLGKQVMDRASAKVQAKMNEIDTNAIVDAAVDQIDPAQITAEAIRQLKKSAVSTAAS
jgi:hypothetical protein